jgi:hypothetical protein
MENKVINNDNCYSLFKVVISNENVGYYGIMDKEAADKMCASNDNYIMYNSWIYLDKNIKYIDAYSFIEEINEKVNINNLKDIHYEAINRLLSLTREEATIFYNKQTGRFCVFNGVEYSDISYTVYPELHWFGTDSDYDGIITALFFSNDFERTLKELNAYEDEKVNQ